MRRTVSVLVAIVAALGALAGLGACSAAPGAAAVPAGAVVIDVRTPAEYAAGHLAGAVNIDIQAADFTARIGKLDRNGQYLLYCRSGSRAGVAKTQMTGMGFTHVTNLGSIDAAAKATGLAVVTG
ncbi:MAG: rhodanese-like domain-containing protein [Micrococcales bacterium]|nr:rhodanese-like domain-containing protein [Micrococcales bacterium]